MKHISGEVLESVRDLVVRGQTIWMADYYGNRVHRVKIEW